MDKIDLTFVIPAKNEEGSVIKLYQEIISTIKPLKTKYEIIFIDDGSTDHTLEKLKQLKNKDKNIKIITLRGNWGKSVALSIGFSQAKGQIIFTLDADLQDNPKEITRFIEKINEGYDLVSGWKHKRHDPMEKVIPSRIFNWLTTTLTGVKVHDTNCGYKAYKKSVVENLNLYGELYRFIPIMAAKQNYKITEIKVEHRKRESGKSKFGLERHVKGILDLITIVFLTGFIRRPGHFFGSLGLLSFSGGFIIGLYITFLRVTTGSIQNHHPLLFLGMLLMIIGVELISTGLIAEMIISTKGKQDYSNTINNII